MRLGAAYRGEADFFVGGEDSKEAPADETTPAPPRYVTSYAEGRLSAESRASEWTPRRSDDEDDSDESEYEADEGMALSP